MKPSRNVLTILLLLCLTFDGLAQYNLLRRGEPSIYDSSVNIEISEYRKVREKVFAADSLIIRLNFEIAQRIDQDLRHKETIVTRDTVIARHERTIAAKDRTIASLSQSFDNLAQVTKKAIIFKNPWADGLAKIGIGIFLYWGVSKLD